MARHAAPKINPDAIVSSRPVNMPSAAGASDGEGAIALAIMGGLLPEALVEHHFAWCCEHSKRFHGRFFAYGHTGCSACFSPIDEGNVWAHEYRHDRDWRFDFAWPYAMVALEVEGGVFAEEAGRHTRGAGFEADAVKYAEAALRGWVVVRFTTDQCLDGTATDYVARIITARVAERAARV